MGTRSRPGGPHEMDLRRIESIGVGRRRKEFHELPPQVEAGVHYLLLRFDKPVAALISRSDYLHFSELARQGKGYDPTTLSVQDYLDLLARHVKEIGWAEVNKVEAVRHRYRTFTAPSGASGGPDGTLCEPHGSPRDAGQGGFRLRVLYPEMVSCQFLEAQRRKFPPWT